MAKSRFCGRARELDRLWLEWRFATEADGQPQVVVILADNGLGKTRLVQEFFGRLAAGQPQPGYWPEALEASGDNLRVNPPLGACRAIHEPAFLWWGLRFAEVERRNAAIAGMDEALPDLSSHLAVLLAGVRDQNRRRRALAALGDAGLDFALELAGEVVAHASLLKTAATLLRTSWGIGREFLADRAPPALAALRRGEQATKAERVVHSIGEVLAARGGRLPVCVFADDAHFADADPDTVDLLRRLLDAARAERWPLLLVLTHWQDRWNAEGSAVARWLKPQSERIVALSLGTLPAQTLAPVLAEGFPNLPPAQASAILARADGNPQFLAEIIRFMAENAGLFALGDRQAALTDAGLAEVLAEAMERHRLNARRFRDLPRGAQTALAVGSVQGPRLLEDLTAEVCSALGLGDAAALRPALAMAEMPHNLIRRDGRWAEFLQGLYREIALREMRNIPLDRAAVQQAITEALRARVLDRAALAGLAAEDRRALLGLAWAILRDADAPTGALAAALLIAERFAVGDELGAGAQAQALAEALAAGVTLPAERLWTVFLALRAIGDWPRARAVAERMLAAVPDAADLAARRLHMVAQAFLAESLARDPQLHDDLVRAEALHVAALATARALAAALDTAEARRDVAVSLDSVADAARARGDVSAAADLFGESLALRRALATAEDTPQARHDVSVSLNNVAGIARARSDLAAAARLYGEALALRRALVAARDTAEARRDLSVSLDNVAAVQRELGNSAAAASLFAESLTLRRALATAPATPEARRDLSVALENVAELAQARGDLAAAARLLGESLALRRALVHDLATPEARRDLSASLNNFAVLVRARGDIPAADAAFADSLSLRRALASDLDTPEARRDLSLSLNHVAASAQARGDFSAAEALFAESLAIRRALAQALATPEARRDFAVALTNVAGVLQARGELAAADKLFAESLDISRALAAEVATPEARRDLAVALNHLAAVRDEAAVLVAESLEISRALARDLATPAARRDLWVALNNVATAARARHDPAARPLLDEALALSRALAAELGTPEARRDLSVALFMLAQILADAGEPLAARPLLTEALRLIAALQRETGLPELLRDQALLLLSLAAVAAAQGDRSGAGAALAEAHEAAAAFGRQQPLSDAASIVAAVDAAQRRLGAGDMDGDTASGTGSVTRTGRWRHLR